MKKILKKIKTIIIAKTRNKSIIKDEWYLDRLEICGSCPLNSKNIKIRKNFKYWFWNLLNLKKPFCTVCGCEIKAKASEEMEKCPEGKWGRVE